jgi:hypothetical protein
MSGSGADSGHPRPAEALAKAELARKLGAIIERRRLTLAVPAEILEIDQPKISALKRDASPASHWTASCDLLSCWGTT